ncbi:MAG: glycoside hydrolase family 16 protein [Chthoniobacter sp.]|uniref:glycoside hydrolase family 16 protein n=1 Tax=Chthoniobacter sp. TaxID=2510640 RepID=UPI0032A46550
MAAPPAGWQLVFSDEFEGQALDVSKWNTTMDFPGTHGPRYHNEYYLSYTLDEDVILSDGRLHLRTEHKVVSGSEPMGLFDYSQGLVTTHDKFTFTYGYVEIRAKYPGGKGLWPCFWLMPQDENSWPPEFDIAEYYGGQHKMHHGLAYGTMRETLWDSSGDTETDFVNDWHTIGLEWTAGRAVWYVDGVARKTVTADYVPKVPMYVLLSNSISSRLGPSGEPDEKTVFPNDFQIDYIRIYQTPPPTQLVKAEPPPAPKPQASEAAKPIIAILPASPLP